MEIPRDRVTGRVTNDGDIEQEREGERIQVTVFRLAMTIQFDTAQASFTFVCFLKAVC